MKAKLFLLFTSIIIFNANAQTENYWSGHVITTTGEMMFDVITYDMGGDGDLDIITLDFLKHEVNWYENLGGANFGDPASNDNIITTNHANAAFRIYMPDIDGDDDLDILHCQVNGNSVIWTENLDGLGDFGDPTTNTVHVTDHANTQCPAGVHYGDIKGNDGDPDVLSASFCDNKIAWYENLGGGDFGDTATNQILITAPANTLGAKDVIAVDLDDDGDIDVLSASWDDDKVAWYENLGGGDFGDINTNQNIISTTADNVWSIAAADINGDGFMDVLSASSADNKIAWYENDGNENFVEYIVVTDAIEAKKVDAADLDGDGDMDLFSASRGDAIAAWYENDGNENFTKHIIGQPGDVPETQNIIAVDLNDDNNMDLIVTGSGGSAGIVKVVWYQYPFLAVDDHTLLDFSVYPSPTTGILNIQSNTTIVQIEIHNQLGQLVLSNSNKNTIDISNVSSGLYFIKVKDENGTIGTQKVVKE